MGYPLVDEILKMPPVHKGTALKEKHGTTLHNRGATNGEFFLVARFIHGLTHVKVLKSKIALETLQDAVMGKQLTHDNEPEPKIPLVLDLGNRELRLPIWSKNGEGWHLAGYDFFNKEAIGVTVPMMRAIERYTGIAESSTLSALHSLSMVAVAPCLIADEPRKYRQPMSGRLINPADGRPLNYEPIENVQGFILDQQRVVEWIEKELKKRETAFG